MHMLEKNIQITKNIIFQVNFHEMKIKKSSEREVRRTFYPGLWVELKTSPYQMQLHAKVVPLSLFSIFETFSIIKSNSSDQSNTN